jgi:4-hydroxybenzoate polyprenyltransferase
MRFKHYLKNVFIFLPLIFSGFISDINSLLTVIWSFLSFSFITSIIYIINDIKDIEKDKLHEKKKNRPLASNKVSIKSAYILIGILVVLSLGCFLLSKVSMINIIYLFCYLIINLFYSYGLKNIPLIDISILVLGFLIRILYGASIINVEVSNWLYLTIMAMSFYLALGKRRNELIKNSDKTRLSLKFYNFNFLDKNMYIFLTLTIAFYSLWASDAGLKYHNLMIWTIPLIIIICMKYSMGIENNNDGDPVEIIFNDKVLMILLLIYGLSILLISIL